MKTEAKKLSWLELPKTIWYFLAEDRARFVFFFFLLAISFLYDLVPVYVVGKIVDFFTSHETGHSLTLFYFYVGFIPITWILVSFVRLSSKRRLGIMRQHARARARIWGFERLTEFSLEWHNKESTGNKLQRIFTGGEALSGWIRLLQRELLKIFVNTVGIILFFFSIDYKFALLVVFYLTTFLFLEFAFGKKIFKLSNQFNQLEQASSGTYMESANNMLSLKALGGEKGAAHRVFDRETLSRDVAVQKINLTNFKWKVFQIINGLALGAFLLLIGKGVVSEIITIGMILVLYTYFNNLQRYMGDISEIYMDMIDFSSGLGQMMPIFRETEFIKTGNESFPKDWNKIEIKNGVMDYGSGQMGLRGFNLTLDKNTKTGIAGLSGSGKSTLAKIILGLYALQSGEFKIGRENNMRDYYSISHNETLSHITVVLQETELFNLSFKDNITMMRGEDTKLLNMAIEISQLKEVIDKLPEGLNSTIGEKGYMLSGGERQRLGIARAIYKNTPIVILDEATSSLDSETEGKIMERLLGQYGRDKTFLIIAHRMGTLKYTDKIAVMEVGRVVEEGSYSELMDNPDSLFHKMNSKRGKLT